MQRPSSELAVHIPYSAHEAGRLLFSANRFSQGRTDGVRYMLAYALNHVDWKPEDVLPAQIVDAVRKRIVTFVGNREFHERIDSVTAVDMLCQQAEMLTLHLETRADIQSALQQCARHIISMDLTYLSAPTGRPRAGKMEAASDYSDPWLSHICHFGIRRTPTGHPIFDAMFADMQPYLLGDQQQLLELLTPFELPQFRRVVALHNQRHPGEQIQLPTMQATTASSS